MRLIASRIQYPSEMRDDMRYILIMLRYTVPRITCFSKMVNEMRYTYLGYNNTDMKDGSR